MSESNTAFKTVLNQFIENEAGDKFYKNSPLLQLQGMGTFNKKDGYTPNVTRMTHARSTKRLNGVAAIDSTDGTVGWNLANVEYLTGEDDRTYTPVGTSRQSQDINIEDQQFKRFNKQHIMNMVHTNVEQVAQLNNDFQRYNNWYMPYTKYITTSATAGTTSFSGFGTSVYESIKVGSGTGAVQSATDTTAVIAAADTASNDDYNGAIMLCYESSAGARIVKYAVVTDYVASTKTVTVADWLTTGGGSGTNPAAGDLYVIYLAASLPTHKLADTHIQFCHSQLDSMGANMFSYGRAGSESVYSFVTSQYTKARLYRDDIATEIQYTDNSRDLLTVSGINKSIWGLAPVVDPRNRRYDANMVEISPTTTSSATRGYKSDFNSDYNPVGQGGLAVYEESFIGAPGLFTTENLVLDNVMADAVFTPQNYMGDTEFLNTKTQGRGSANPRGKIGYFDCQWIRAARPGMYENGIAVFSKLD